MTSAVSALLLSAVAVLPEGGTNLLFRAWNDSMPRVGILGAPRSFLAWTR